MVGFGEGKNPSHTTDDPRKRAIERPTFADIVGQAQLKRALLAVAANDGLDGLLIQGEKGTAKSTAVRALAGHLPTQQAVVDCPYGCHPSDPERQCTDCRAREQLPVHERPVPLVTLPLGATRERVVGTLSVADALAGEAEFDPGLLARANRGILYVDEINLLEDHLVDVLLDAAASGRNLVERDGVSVTHPAEFTLVGTMNPEEGELRPQLRDRFALQATVTGCQDLDRRVEIIDQAMGEGNSDSRVATNSDRRVATNSDSPPATAERPPEKVLAAASDRLDAVSLPTDFKREIAELCRDAGVDGHRGDIATAQTAVTLAALDDRSTVIEGDLREAAALALPHRLQSQPFEDAPDPEDILDEHFEDGPDESEGEQGQHEGNADESDADNGEAESDGGDDPETEKGDAEPDTGEDGSESDTGEDGSESAAPSDGPESAPGNSETSGEDAGASDRSPSGGDADDGTPGESGGDGPGSEADGDDQTATPLLPGQSREAIGESAPPEIGVADAIDGEATGGNRSQSAPSTGVDGPRVRSTQASASSGIDAAASVRAAGARGKSSVESRDLRQSVRQTDAGALVVFVVDASASMRPAMAAAKGTVLELLKDAYQHRDEVAFVAFAGESAEVLLPPTDSVTLAARHLKELPTGDRTPLPDGLRTARDVVARAAPESSVVVLVTDGKANVANGSPVAKTRNAARALRECGSQVVVVDAGDPETTGVAELVATETGGTHLPLESLSAARIDSAVSAAHDGE